MTRPAPLMVPSSAAKSAQMSRQKSEDTSCEKAVRSLLHAQGLRYRLHTAVPDMRRRKIDITFGQTKVAVFLDGCFWHSCPVHGTLPKSNAAWWREKLDRNTERDRETTAHLESRGWTVLRFWEHEAPEDVAGRVAETVRRLRAARSKRE
ncbi:very short patch repair endonuclease [Streptomyces sp. NPDC058953]|uniref:very short patch repair endonuclease n=1 Tax=unclassified Streptomyces TaxID=2593676 RepID=UPI00369951BE